MEKEFIPKPLKWARNPDNTLKLSPQAQRTIANSPMGRSLQVGKKKIEKFDPLPIIRQRLNVQSFVQIRKITQGLTTHQARVISLTLGELTDSGKVKRLYQKGRQAQYRLIQKV